MAGNGGAGEKTRRKLDIADICKYASGALIAAFAAYIFIIPGVITIFNLNDPGLGGEDIPRMAWRQHRALTPRYEEWARDRVASGAAANVSLHDVPDTEWAIFGSVYYLWATENLQKAWEKDNNLSSAEPRLYARDAIEAAVDLIMDTNHHAWVKTHWGEDYMHRENVFFRSLIIAGLTSHEELVGDGRYRAVLRDQVDSLSADLDASPHGVLNDYPYQCYPIDVFAAIATIQRADSVLGTDHSEFVARSVRAFEGDMLDERGLIPYFMDAETGQFGPNEPSRGTGNSYTLIFAPELWPARAKEWYGAHEEHFWQELSWAEGFREYPRDLPGREWGYDVDAGPITAGFSPSANSFGLAASKANGRLDHHEIIGSQVIAACWPLADGTWLGPRILSDAASAPMLGEACLLFSFTQTPAEGVDLVSGGHWPLSVYIGLTFYFGMGLLLLSATWFSLRRWTRKRKTGRVPSAKAQCVVWSALVVAAAILFAFGFLRAAIVIALLSTLVPRLSPFADAKATVV